MKSPWAKPWMGEGSSEMKGLIEIRWHGCGGQGAKTAPHNLLPRLPLRRESSFRPFPNMARKDYKLPISRINMRIIKT